MSNIFVMSMLQGGLGNQLFQLAATYGVHRNTPNSQLIINPKATHNIQGFNGHPASRYIPNLFSAFSVVDAQPAFVYKEPCFAYRKIVLPPAPPYVNPHYMLAGYFQSEKYLEGYTKDFLELLQWPTDVVHATSRQIDAYRQNKRLVGVHLRLGDYLRMPNYFDVCRDQYYTNAYQTLDGPNTKFLLFTDDPATAQSIPRLHALHATGRVEIWKTPETYGEIGDLIGMSLCDDLIIANSSFSWWSALLLTNASKDARIVAPSQWFGPQGPQDTQDIYLGSWTKVSNV